MKHPFVTEVEYEDSHGNVEVRKVVTEMPSAEAVIVAKAAYAFGTSSHEQAVAVAALPAWIFLDFAKSRGW